MEGRLSSCFTNEDRTAYAAAEIATLRLELTAAKASIQETDRHNVTETEHFRAICQRIDDWVSVMPASGTGR